MQQSTTQSKIISLAIEGIKHNNKFSQKINYHLNSLKPLLQSSEKVIEHSNALELIQQPFLSLISEIMIINNENKLFFIYSGEIIFHLTRILIKDDNQNYKDELLKTINIFLEDICKNNLPYIKVFCEANKYFITNLIQIDQLMFLLNLLCEYILSFPSLSLEETEYCLIELIQNAITMKEYIDVMDKEMSVNVIKIINNVIGRSLHNKTVITCSYIIELMLLRKECKEYYSTINPILFLFNIMCKFPNDAVLSFRLCSLVMSVINQRDLSFLLSILQIKDYQSLTGDNIEEFHNDNDNELKTSIEMMKEIKSIIFSQNNEFFLSFKTSIIKLTIVAFKEQSFGALIDKNLLNCFLGLLIGDIDSFNLIKNKSDINDNIVYNKVIPELMLILSCIRNKTLDDLKTNDSNLIKSILYCLFKCLGMVISNEEMAEEILSDLISVIKNNEQHLEAIINDDHYQISSDEIDNTLTQLLLKYNQKEIVHDFLSSLVIDCIIPSINTSSLNQKDSSCLFNTEIEMLSESINIYMLNQSEETKKDIQLLLNKLSVKLLLKQKSTSNLLQIAFNDNCVQLYISVCSIIVNLVNTCASVLDDKVFIDHLITFHFAGLSNILFGDESSFKIKEILLLELVSKIDINSYFIQLLSNLISSRNPNLHNNHEINYLKDLIVDDVLTQKVFQYFNFNSDQLNQNYLRNIVFIINTFISFPSENQDIRVSMFIKEKGIINIINLSIKNCFDSDTLQLVTNIIQKISSNDYFKESVIIYQHKALLKQLILSFQEITISNGINELIYAELLIYLKRIFKLSEMSTICKETTIISHLLKELIVLSTLSIDKSIIIMEIMAVISLNSKMLNYLTDDKLVTVLNNNLSQMINDNQYNDNCFNSILTIMNSLIKSKEYNEGVYKSSKWKSILMKIREIIVIFVNQIEDMVKVIDYCLNVIIFERKIRFNRQNNSSDNDIFDITYFKHLETVIEGFESLNKQNDFVKELINKSMKLINDPNLCINKLYTTEERISLHKEITLATKRDKFRKAVYEKANPSQVTTKRRSYLIVNNYNADNKDNTENNKDYLSDHLESINHRRSIDLSKTPHIKAHFNQICIQLVNCIEAIINKTQSDHEEELFDDCDELSELLRLLKFFVKKIKTAIEMLYESGIIPKLLSLLDNSNVYLNTKYQCLKFIDKVITPTYSHNKLIEDVVICEYFIREMPSISTYNSSFYSHKFAIGKVQIITKIMSILSQDKSFIKNNPNIFSEEKIIKDLTVLIKERAVISNLFQILKNILLVYCHNSEIKFAKELGEVILLAWNMHQNDQSILSLLYSIINIGCHQTNFINIITDNFDIEQITHGFSPTNLDINSFHLFLLMSNSLITHNTSFGDKLVNDNFMKRLIDIANDNIFNMKITEQILLFFANSVQYNQKLGKFICNNLSIHELFIIIMNKYKTTCHKHIIKSTLQLVHSILNNCKKNIQYFIKEDIFDVFIKVIHSNINTLDIIQIGLKLLIKITSIIKEEGDVAMQTLPSSMIIVKTTKNTNDQNYINGDQYSKKVMSHIQTRPCSIIISNFINNDNHCNEENTIMKTDDNLKNRKSQLNYKCFFEIISKVLNVYSENLDILPLTLELATNVDILSLDTNVKTSLIKIILYEGLTFSDKNQANALILIIDTLISLITNDNIKTNRKGCYIDESSIFSLINEIFKFINCNEIIILSILKLIYTMVKEDTIQKDSIMKDIFQCLTKIKDNPTFQNQNIIPKISQILSLLCIKTKAYKGIPYDFIIFFLQYIMNHDTNKYINLHLEILDDAKIIVNYISIDSSEIAISISAIIIKLYEIYRDKKDERCLVKIFQIISGLSIQSNLIKKALNDCDFAEELKEQIDYNVYNEELVEYQAKGCLVNLNQKKDQYDINPAITKVRLMQKKIIVNQIGDHVKEFLEKNHLIKLYLADGTQIKACIQMNKSLDKITAVIREGNAYVIKEEMNLSEMDYCVRSASTAAFKKATGFFSKKPKPSKCFSILGKKMMNKKQETFNVECNNEEECIAYVDYISLLINNYKSIEENINSKI